MFDWLNWNWDWDLSLTLFVTYKRGEREGKASLVELCEINQFMGEFRIRPPEGEK